MATIIIMIAVIVFGIVYGMSGGCGAGLERYGKIGAEFRILSRKKCYKLSELRKMSAVRKFSAADMLIHGVMKQRLLNRGGKSEVYGGNEIRKYAGKYTN